MRVPVISERSPGILRSQVVLSSWVSWKATAVKATGNALRRATVSSDCVASMTSSRFPPRGAAGSVNPYCRSTTRTAGRSPTPTREPIPLRE